MGFCITAGIHIAIILVTGWITVIDGGKTKSTPKWAKWFSRFSYYGIYFSELAGGWFEYRVGDARKYYGALNGSVNGSKYIVMMFVCFTWGILSWVYGRKISVQLKSGNRKASPEEKRIKRYCYSCASLMTMGFFWRLAFLPGKFGKVVQAIPPCEFSFFSLLNVMLYMVQYGCLYAQQPGKKKYTTRAYEAVRSTVKSGVSSKSR